MINVGDRVKVVRLIESDCASHPIHVIGNTYEVKEITDSKVQKPFKYGLDIGEVAIIFFADDEVEKIN